MKKLFAILFSVLIILVTSVSYNATVVADGGPNDECEDAQATSITGTNDLVTYTAPSGNIVSGVCIKSGSGMFGDSHSESLGDGTYEVSGTCYSVSGVGTDTATVARNFSSNTCKGISHIDVYYSPDQTEEVEGCTDLDATNYDPSATVDDDSCEYEEEEETDVCPNIEDVQESVPQGYELDDSGNCVEEEDTGGNDEDPIPTPTPDEEEETGDSDVTPTPTVQPDPTATPSNPGGTGGPGDGLSDGRSDGLSDGKSSGGSVLGANTSQKQGEVLGTSTLAATGNFGSSLATIEQVLGLALAMLGAVYGKKKELKKKSK